MARVVRSAKNRDQASSPPSESSNRPSQSPVRRRTTRSQSADVGPNNFTTFKGRKPSAPERGSRQGSVESVASVGSNASKGSKGRRKKVAHIPVVEPELSMVAEDEESDGASDDDEIQEITSDGEQLMDEMAQHPQSPGAMSGTTAMTSETSKEVSHLNIGMIVEVLPDLLQSAKQVLDLLVPPNLSNELVQTICKDLLVPGSNRGLKLKHKEKNFEHAAEHYTSEIDTTAFPFIKASSINLKLFDTNEPPFEEFRPDAIIYAANLTFLIKAIYVLNKDSPDAHRDLQFIESVFPVAFLSEFDDDPQFGSSSMTKESFDLGLELRTQITIAILKHFRESAENQPEDLLREIFFDPSSGDVKSIAGFSTDSYEDLILSRYEVITGAFNEVDEETSNRDLVDFDQLDVTFPWTDFVFVVADWTRKRFIEICQNISDQGGIKGITKSLANAVKENDSQLDLDFQSPSSPMAAPPAKETASELLPAPKITSKSTGRNSFAASAAAALKRRYKELGEQPPIPSSNLLTPSNRQPRAPERATEPARITAKMQQQAFENLGHSAEDTDGDLAEGNGLGGSPILGGSIHSRDRAESPDSPPNGRGHEPADDNDYQIANYEEDDDLPELSQQLLAGWKKVSNDKNKENRPVLPVVTAKRWIDPQAGATRITFDGDDELPVSTARRGGRSQREASEESEDQGFERDDRTIDPSRRASARVPRQMSPPKSTSRNTSKRTRDDVDHAEDRRQKKARIASLNDEVENEDEVAAAIQRRRTQPRDDSPPPSTFQEVMEMAKAESAKVRSARNTGARKRTPWSEHDTNLLVKYIGNYGCAWAEIEKIANFEDERTQVNLKDKARNMKAAYLKAGITKNRLPRNFEHVRLDEKNRVAVRKVLGNVDDNGYELDD